MKRIYALYKDVIQNFACIQAYQAPIYNKSHCNLPEKVGQKVQIIFENITINLPSQNLF